jgi:5-methylcytosine-specific restriction endonuclease McrA
MTAAKRREDLLKRPWTDAEDALLRLLYPTAARAELRESFPERSRTAIRRRASELGISREISRAEQTRRGWEETRGVVAPVIERDGVKGKACVECLAWKPLEEFALHATCVGGRRNVCGPCDAERHPYKHETYLKRRPAQLAAAKAWREANPEKRRASALAYRARRVARLKEGPGVSLEELRLLDELYGGLCAYCREEKATGLDHVIPLSKGGRHEFSNVLPACHGCNCSKGALPLDVWLARRAKEH